MEGLLSLVALAIRPDVAPPPDRLRVLRIARYSRAAPRTGGDRPCAQDEVQGSIGIFTTSCPRIGAVTTVRPLVALARGPRDRLARWFFRCTIGHPPYTDAGEALRSVASRMWVFLLPRAGVGQGSGCVRGSPGGMQLSSVPTALAV